MEDAKALTVLVVDDEPDVRRFLQTALEDAGFTVMTAGNGKQALDRMTERRPDVISLDLVMPRMTGLKFFEYIQKNKDRACIPVVVVTAHARDEMGSGDLDKLKACKSDDCRLYVLEKPVKSHQYVNTVREAVSLPALDVAGGDEALRLLLTERARTADRETLEQALRILKG